MIIFSLADLAPACEGSRSYVGRDLCAQERHTKVASLNMLVQILTTQKFRLGISFYPPDMGTGYIWLKPRWYSDSDNCDSGLGRGPKARPMRRPEASGRCWGGSRRSEGLEASQVGARAAVLWRRRRPFKPAGALATAVAAARQRFVFCQKLGGLAHPAHPPLTPLLNKFLPWIWDSTPSWTNLAPFGLNLQPLT